MNSMTYRGYTARVDFDGRDDIFVGRVLGTRDAIVFHADTVDGLRNEFKVSVDDYLAFCAERGIAPDKPASGRLMLRIPPEVHAAAVVAAKAAGESLNQWAARVLAAAAR
ncbi:MAG: type II toxin-antitoxin system HicB family antitoxin [Acidobacteriota bacterium]|jgi:predicted HicB family RNase H-like nuclease|nr:type II toxin-antitoxin system HicB family antitoxin [Acidobacteriota bacterium]